MGRILWVLLACASAACSGGSSSQGEGTASRSDGAGAEPWFVERAREVGLDFRHVSALEQRFHFPEITSGGVALFDYDGDLDLDVYFVQGGDLVEPERAPANQLFQNDGGGHFTDVTAAAGVGDRGYGMGVACGDYDGDGDVDLYVTNVGPNVLYQNQGDGSFRDVSAQAGTADPGWGTSAAFVDFDDDGDLDLFSINYIEWDADKEKVCHSTIRTQRRDYCPPKVYGAPARDTLYENLGDGTFRDVTEERGLGAGYGNGLGVVWGDLNGDGRTDLYVANDGTPNNLWLAGADGRFVDGGMLEGAALGGAGQAEAGMGVVAADLEQDGDLDLFLAHLHGEPNTVYLRDGKGFQERTAMVGLGAASRAFTGFGLGLCDFDHDGWLDCYVANGHVVEDPMFDESRPYVQPDQVFQGAPGGRFREVLPRGGTALPLVETGRAAAFGDLDGDGDVDVVVVNRDASAYALFNAIGDGRPWIGFHVLDASGAPALGARVELVLGGTSRSARVQAAFSFQASNEPRVHFGLAGAGDVAEVVVTWPDGSEESFGPRAVGANHVLRRAAGTQR